MKTILEIKTPSSKHYILWEHALKSVFAFAGTFALMIFLPLLFEGKRRSKHYDNDSSYSVDLIMYLSENPNLGFIICGIVTAIYNVQILIKNSQKKYVIRITQLDDKLVFVMSNLIFKGENEKSIPIQQTAYQIESKTTDDHDKTQKLKFIDTQSGEIIGEINPQHICWNAQIKDIRKALLNLSEMGIEKKTVNKTTDSVASIFFK